MRTTARSLKNRFMPDALPVVLPALFAVLLSGCGEPEVYVPPPPRQVIEKRETSELPAAIPAGFAPARVDILPLTELAASSNGVQNGTLHVYVALVDAFASPVKAPGVLRFELYEYVQRSAQPKGQRITIWPDIDLTSPVQNNTYWRDFLRAYEFELDARVGRDRAYVLEATYLSPDGRRLSGASTLKPSP